MPKLHAGKKKIFNHLKSFDYCIYFEKAISLSYPFSIRLLSCPDHFSVHRQQSPFLQIEAQLPNTIWGASFFLDTQFRF